MATYGIRATKQGQYELRNPESKLSTRKAIVLGICSSPEWTTYITLLHELNVTRDKLQGTALDNLLNSYTSIDNDRMLNDIRALEADGFIEVARHMTPDGQLMTVAPEGMYFRTSTPTF